MQPSCKTSEGHWVLHQHWGWLEESLLMTLWYTRITLPTSSGLALAGTWTLQNVWGFTRSCSRQNGWEWPFYDSMMLLALACLSYVWQPVCKCPLWLCGLRLWAVDDTKNHLTYFVRVDWHLPGRELSKMSEVSQGHAVARMVGNGRFTIPWCCLRWHVCHMFGSLFVSALFDCAVWGCEPLMTPKITLPTLFEWTGTCRDVNSPKCLRFHKVMQSPEWLGMAVLRFHDVACVGMSVICLAACL